VVYVSSDESGTVSLIPLEKQESGIFKSKLAHDNLDKGQ
jgi:hypothetical protein